MTLTQKFQDCFNEMHTRKKVTIELDFYEVSQILAALKATDRYSRALEEHMNHTFVKVEQEISNEICVL